MFSTPVELSDAQIAAFEQIYNGNYRPVQPFNDRTFLQAGAAAPATLPVSGEVSFPLAGVLLRAGVLTVAMGLYLRNRKAP